MMKKVLIIDDEKRIRDFVKRMIDSFGLDLTVYTDGENVETGLASIESLKPDIVFLDIQMPDGTGFDLLNRVKEKNFELIFITAFQEYAIMAIKFSALDYILKPIDEEELRTAIINAIDTIDFKKDDTQFEALSHNLLPNQKRKLVLKTQESVHVVDLSDIIRCEADKNYTFFYLSNGKKILVSRTLKDFETLLSNQGFFRVQQSHLINLDFIDRYDKQEGGSVILKDGSSVPLSPAKKEQFFTLLEKL
ncbi:MAG: DNA-binding response regulator [Flavobacteriia bacterium]|nr:DNA-binding response regulator [Flavobacteriia bacterium]NBV67377.1 DNA-binding response regulator [Flavobacteriia bacterium]NBV91846.1 DNA-binding response regulator [Flavobacteriia bacterium]NBY40105.1 DNA-binding response regulator [Flavobacteriia bacterium]